MPRVLQKRRTRGGSKTYRCEGCGEEITPGQRYYEWTKYRSYPQRQHVKCGYPRPSQLSNSKMAVIDEAVAKFDISGAESIEDIKSALEDLAGEARSVAEEYAESASNIEQAFPSGNATSEACQTASAALDSWADDLEGWEPGDKLDEMTEEEFVEQERYAANELLADQPSYEG